MNKIDELSQYWAERLWEIRPLDADLLPVTNVKGDPEPEWTMGLYHPTGDLICVGRSDKELRDLLFSHYSPNYTADFGACLIIIKYLQAKGAWVNISSPFIPKDKEKPILPFYWPQWEKTRDHWFVSVHFHGTTDTNPLWKASDENPARAICDAGRQWMEHIESND